ncbi:MAG: DNA-binding protein [Chloroflexi bacterium]|nr:DNA-binding protein [Chloroflexota bacterium]
MATHYSGKISEVIYAHMDPGEDLVKSIFNICKECDIQTGLVMSITGALQHTRILVFTPTSVTKHETEVIDIPGEVEISGHGILGRVYAPEMGSTPFSNPGYVHGEPYLHIHATCTSAHQTLCGHLLEGTLVSTRHPKSHFTIVLGKVEGVKLQMTCDPAVERAHFSKGIFHRLLPA